MNNEQSISVVFILNISIFEWNVLLMMSHAWFIKIMSMVVICICIRSTDQGLCMSSVEAFCEAYTQRIVDIVIWSSQKYAPKHLDRYQIHNLCTCPKNLHSAPELTKDKQSSSGNSVVEGVAAGIVLIALAVVALILIIFIRRRYTVSSIFITLEISSLGLLFQILLLEANQSFPFLIIVHGLLDAELPFLYNFKLNIPCTPFLSVGQIVFQLPESYEGNNWASTCRQTRFMIRSTVNPEWSSWIPNSNPPRIEGGWICRIMKCGLKAFSELSHYCHTHMDPK